MGLVVFFGAKQSFYLFGFLFDNKLPVLICDFIAANQARKRASGCRDAQ